MILLVLNPCNLSPCNNGGICKATRNIYECVCKPGYQGRNCEKEINECESSPCYQGATCLDKVCELCSTTTLETSVETQTCLVRLKDYG